MILKSEFLKLLVNDLICWCGESDWMDGWMTDGQTDRQTDRWKGTGQNKSRDKNMRGEFKLLFN